MPILTKNPPATNAHTATSPANINRSEGACAATGLAGVTGRVAVVGTVTVASAGDCMACFNQVFVLLVEDEASLIGSEIGALGRVEGFTAEVGEGGEVLAGGLSRFNAGSVEGCDNLGLVSRGFARGGLAGGVLADEGFDADAS